MPKAAAKSLKQRNLPQLVLLLTFNVVLLGVCVLGVEKLGELITSVRNGDLAIIVRVMTVPALAGLLVGIVSWMVPRSWKESLVFWHTGPRRLPSSEAFTKVAHSDQRVDLGTLSLALGTLPDEYGKQSSLWYSIYRTHRNEVEVIDANSAYLLYREMVGLVATLTVTLIVIAVWIRLEWRVSVLVAAALACEFLMVIFAARHAGARLVGNVLALECAVHFRIPSTSTADGRAEKKKTPRTPRAPKKKAAGS